MSLKNFLRSNTLLTSLAALSLGLCVNDASASSHREAPNIAGNPRVDGTDLYMFRSYEAGRSAYTTIIANYNPLQDAFGGPNYFALDPNAIYEIHIDNVGDAHEHLTYQFKFNQALNGGNGIGLNINGTTVAIPLKEIGAISSGSQANLNFNETYTVTQIVGDRRTGARGNVSNHADSSTTFTKPYDYSGNKTFTNLAGYNAYANQYIYTIDIPGCGTPGKMFVGQRKEGFSVNLGKIFDLVNFVPVDGDTNRGSGDGTGFGGGITQDPNNNLLKNKNITSIALEIPTTCLTGTGNGVIGAWTTASLPQAKLLNPGATFALPEVVGGAYTQMSRLGMPLVNEVVIGLKDKDHFNASKPSGDAQFLTYVTNPTFPAILNVLFGGNAVAPTNFPRNDLIATYLTGFVGINQLSTVTPSEMLRLNTTTAITARGSQNPLGIIATAADNSTGTGASDPAGFPNGRRPGDDVVDITLRVAEGRLCQAAYAGLGLCTAGQATSGANQYTDGAPVKDTDFLTAFPYLNPPIAGSDAVTATN